MKFEELKVGSEFIESGEYIYYIYTVSAIFDDYVKCTNGAIKSKFCIENDCYHILDLSYVRSVIKENKIEYYKDKIMNILIEDDPSKEMLNEEYNCLQLAIDKLIIEHRRMVKNEK